MRARSSSAARRGSCPIAGAGVPQRLYHFKIDQEVKGDLGSTVSVRVPVKPENGGQVIPEDTAAGILMNRANGTWFTTRCGITDPGVVLAGSTSRRATRSGC